MEKPNYWAELYKKYYRTPKNEESDEQQSIGMPYDEMRRRFYKKTEVIADEPIIPDEEYKKEMELVNEYERVNAELETTNEVKNEAILQNPKDNNELTAEEIEEFKRLNGITDEHEQPTETKVKSVKVSKPKETKTEKEKPTKQKETKPKSPRKPKK